MSKHVLPIIGLLLSTVLHAQITITGTVSDGGNGDRLAYVNIGIRNKNIGTVSDINGAFTLALQAEHLKDTLTLSQVGYGELRLPVANMAVSSNEVKLKRLRNGLPEVVCKTSSLKEIKYGLWRYAPLLHFLDGSIAQHDAFEIAQLIKFGNSRAKITSVNLHINEALKDSVTFRINFYNYEGNRPGKRVVDKSILQTRIISEGWLRFDLAKYNIYLKGPVVVAIEIMPGRAQQQKVVYEIKPGGRAKSFVRTSSLGNWQVPPHQYRMFATALATEGSGNTGEESKDIAPAYKLFSKTVQDSFSIFVRLPRRYNIARRYPVVYVLDANIYFPYLSDSLDKMKRDDIILVGIGYKDFVSMDSLRLRDYTYPAAAADSCAVCGGGNNFYHFLRDELVAFIDSAYRTDKQAQHLMGHSLGGYFVLFALALEAQSQQCSFTHYVSASPSVEYHHTYIADQYSGLHLPQKKSAEELYISWGAEEEKDEDGGAQFSAALTRLFQCAGPVHFGVTKLQQEKFQGAGHMETALPSFYNALTRAIAE